MKRLCMVLGVLVLLLALVVLPAQANVPGDVDGDGHVNAVDWSLLCAAYLSYPAEFIVNPPVNARWDARCDFNGDGQVTCLDASLLILHYGE